MCVCAARPLPVANTAHEAQSFPPLEDKENVKARRCCMQQDVYNKMVYAELTKRSSIVSLLLFLHV